MAENPSDKARKALHSSLSNEWYTPPKFIEAARRVMGGIDLDPASNGKANLLVGAHVYYDQHDDGLSLPWFGRVWLNPPYGKTGNISNQDIWTYRVVREYHRKAIQEAVLLVNAATDTVWFQRLWPFTICFVEGRIKFIHPDSGQGDQPTHPSAIVYLGRNTTRFEQEFQPFGAVVRRVIVAARKASGEGWRATKTYINSVEGPLCADCKVELDNFLTCPKCGLIYQPKVGR